MNDEERTIQIGHKDWRIFGVEGGPILKNEEDFVSEKIEVFTISTRDSKVIHSASMMKCPVHGRTTESIIK